MVPCSRLRLRSHFASSFSAFPSIKSIVIRHPTMTTLDSVAAFSERMEELGLMPHLENFKKAKWFTFANLAFSAPQAGNEETFIRKVLIPGLGSADHEDEHLLRRLFFEAFNMAAADLRRRSEATTEDGPRVMPAAERRERFLRVESRLKPGIKMRGELEVSFKLIERCVHMWDANTIKYLPLELCTKRNDEVRGIEKDPLWATVPDPASGRLLLKQVRDDVRSAVDGQFAYNFAMQRRAIGMEMADIMSFENGDELRDIFVAAMMKAPFSGFEPFSCEQVLEADLQFWLIIAELTRDGVKRKGSADRPCDVVFQRAIDHRDFQIAMTPRQRQATRPAAAHPSALFAPHHPAAGAAGVSKNSLKKQKAAAKSAASRVAAAFQAPQGGKAQGQQKGQGKGKNKDQQKGRLPPGLMGMCPRSSAATGGKRMCYSFNLGQCTACAPGQECARGSHLCMKPAAGGEACSKAHAATSNACA